MQKVYTLLTCILLFCSFTAFSQDDSYDLLIINGRIIDGTGNPWFYADIGVVDDKIVKIGRIESRNAKKIVDAEGLTVIPGFIDIHSHADGPIGHRNGIRAKNPLLRAAHNMVMQGVTTLVVNHDGRSPVSIAAQRKQLEEQGFGPNVAMLVGHNSIRARALGENYQRTATDEEIERMKESIREGMEAGAYGLSAGLEYVPGRWSNTEEVVELASELKAYGGVFIVHERFSGSDPMWFLPSRDGESPGTILDNVREVIEIAEKSGVTTCATHIKVKGADFWGVGPAIVHLINTARNRGVDVWADQYPYNTTGSDGNTVLIPDWALQRDRWSSSLSGNPEDANRTQASSYAEALKQVLADKSLKQKFAMDVEREIERRGGPNNVLVFDFPDSNLIGKSIQAIANEKNLSLLETAVYLQQEGFPKRPGGARLRGFSLNEMDIETLAAQPWVITASDAGLGLPGGPPVHARFYGTFPRKIAWYAKERKALSVENAIRSATSLPAQFMGFKDRGLLKEGYKADIAIIDLDQLRDKATFVDPHQYPEGVRHVLVNGEFLVENVEISGNLPGRILTWKESFRAK